MRAHTRCSLRRAAVALSASVIAAAGAGTAHADPPAQLNNVGAAAGAVAASTQGVSANVNAPVRVLSDGDDAGTAGEQGNASQASAGDLAASTQGVSANVNAPVRVLSDGDSGSETAGGQRNEADAAAADVATSAQGSGGNVNAPVQAGAGGAGGGIGNAVADSQETGQDTAGGIDEDAATNPDLVSSPQRVASGERGGGALSISAALLRRGPSRAVLGASVSEQLPVTGFPAWLLALVGGGLLASGLVLRFAPRATSAG